MNPAATLCMGSVAGALCGTDLVHKVGDSRRWSE
jgi:hypothetical protein